MNGASQAPVLEVRSLVKHFPTRRGVVHAVDDVSFTVGRAETFGIVGESGSGKSTLGRCLVGLTPANAGRVEVLGTDIAGAPPAALRRMRSRFNIVFQDPSASLDPRRRVGSIIAEPALTHGVVSRRGVREHVLAMMDRVGLGARLIDRYPHELSGGQRQRVSIARALSAGPDLLVADEPTSALDVSVQAAVLNLLADLQADLGFSCVFISHDLSAVEYLADRIAVMYLGQIVEMTDTADLFANTQHPYTQALLAAAPMLPEPGAARRPPTARLSGEVPSAIDLPAGCRFAGRCPLAFDRCRVEEPALRAVDGGPGVAACHLVGSPSQHATIADPEDAPS